MRFACPLFLFTSSLILKRRGLIRAFAPKSNKKHQLSSLLPPQPRSAATTMFSASSSSSTVSWMETIESKVNEALGRDDVKLVSTTGGGASGGGGATTGGVLDQTTNTKYFIKSASPSGGGMEMLRAEYLGVKKMDETNTIRVPKPICYGVFEGPPSKKAFVVFEYLQFGYGGSEYELGQQLAKMHRHYSENGKFGFDVDNTIGATPQPNLPWKDDWADFWDEHRLGHMFKLLGGGGYSPDEIEALRAKTRQLLSHKPLPSLIHGDLWGGNKGYAKASGEETMVPVIFDPATYYGDREADIGMTYVFGGFGAAFYQGYEDEWPLPEGHEKRRVVYNLYHILNHEVLFGGYMGQARGMISQIMRM